MARRCGCVGNECNCRILPGRAVGFSGSGDEGNPLAITQSGSAYMQSGSTNDTDVLLTGTGTVGDPYVLGMDFNGVPDAAVLDLQTYTTPGTFTWRVPAGCSLVEVIAIGGGAGGTAGQTAPLVDGGWGSGGAGGQGGGWSRKIMSVPSGTVDASISVGYGGGGGTGPGAPTGAFGFPSFFTLNLPAGATNRCYANGGAPTSSGAVAGAGTHRGGSGVTLRTDPQQQMLTPAPGGGGRGANGNEDIFTSNVPLAGGTHVAYDGVFTGPTIAALSALGGDGGRGGRSFSSGALNNPGYGTNGYAPGGGGGGGRGGGRNINTFTFDPGIGSAGANGLVRVIAY